MRKKVVLLSGSLKLSGSATWILNLHRGFRQLDVDVIHIMTSGSSLHNLPQDFRVFYTGSKDKTFLIRLLRAFRFHKWAASRYEKILDGLYSDSIKNILDELGWSDKVDMVVKDFTAYLPPVLAQYPVIPTIHQQLSVNWHNPKLKKKANQVAKVFAAVSEATKRDAESLGITVKKAIYNPIDIDNVRLKSSEYSVSIDNYIVFVGSLNANKGVYQLMDAFSLLKDKVNLCYVGTGKDDAGLKARAAELGISDRVTFTGFLSNPYPYISKARLLVLPTQSDTMGDAMPYVPIEASILNVPILVSDFKGVTEFFDESAIVPQEPKQQFVGCLSEAINNVLANGQAPAFKESVLAQMNPEVAARNFLALLD